MTSYIRQCNSLEFTQLENIRHRVGEIKFESINIDYYFEIDSKGLNFEFARNPLQSVLDQVEVVEETI